LIAGDPRVGTVLGERYRIDALIGEGGMGKVYAAEHVMMKKRLAVKVLHRELTSVPDVVARFEREAMAAANIEHPNVAAATDFGKLADGSVFLVLEFVQGRNLRDEMADGPLPVERALHIARQIAAGLGSAHLQGIVHRDLKPENVMLVEKAGDRDFVKVLDFGIAKVPIDEVPTEAKYKDQPITRAGMVFGTPEYMAPEQALGQTVDGRADLYALGVIVFELLAGMRPFASQSPVGILGQQLANPPPSFAARAPLVLVPPAVEQIVHRLLARDREQRYASAAEVVAALDVLLAPIPGRGGYRYTLADGSLVTHTEAIRPPPPPALVSNGPGAGTVDPSPSGAQGASGITNPSLPKAPALPGASQAARERAPLPVRLRYAVTTLAEPGFLKARVGAWFRGVQSGRWLESVGPRAESLRERLPARIRESLRPVPTRALVIAGALSALVIGILGLAVVIALVRSLSSDTAQEALAPAPSASAPRELASAPALPGPPDAASPAELERATKGGPAALDALADRYPSDPNPRIEAARAWVWARDFSRATAAVGRVVAMSEESKTDERVGAVLFQAAQARPSMDAAFTLLTGPMGARGAEIVWDLAADAEVQPHVQQRAGAWIRTPAFRKVAPASLRLAADLRTVKTCQAARALLPAAKAGADHRSLSQLEAWRKTTGCGKKGASDCMACLREDSLLEQTISAIESRRPNASGPVR
jgi:serine/threonine-protein kinase